MDETLLNAVFKPRLSRQETKADATTRIAREMVNAEVVKREAKTERLRLARLELEKNTPPPATEASPKKKATRGR